MGRRVKYTTKSGQNKYIYLYLKNLSVFEKNTLIFKWATPELTGLGGGTSGIKPAGDY
ncbi:MAG: hypothetical protein HYT61_02845 [Candidatus Yanofskybacteria bacterium]|nr:hypothetical protein [Candidatus Yanofskybacteria bacterium]